jgi:hypothetical protein
MCRYFDVMRNLFFCIVKFGGEFGYLDKPEATEPDAANGWDWDGWNPKPGLRRHKRAESGQ